MRWMYGGRSESNDSTMDHSFQDTIYNRTITIKFNLLMSHQGNVCAHGISGGNVCRGSNSSVLLGLLTEECQTLLADKENWEKEKKLLEERVENGRWYDNEQAGKGKK